MEYAPLTEEYKARCLSKLAAEYELPEKELQTVIDKIGNSYSQILSYEELLASIIAARVVGGVLLGSYIGEGLRLIFDKLSEPDILIQLKLVGVDSLESFGTKYNNANIALRDSFNSFFGGRRNAQMLIDIFSDQKQPNSIFYKVLNTLAKEPTTL